MNRLSEDLRFALRQLRRSPAFALFVIATLAIGIGANTTIFGAVNAVVLRPLPYANSDRLVGLTGAYLNRGNEWSVSLPNAVDWGTRSQAFEGYGYYQGGTFTLVGDDRPERLSANRSSAGLLELLGARPVLGRLFNAEEDRPSGERVVVLSHNIWQNRFGGDRAVLGRTLTLSGQPHVVVGVLPAGFSFPQPDIDLYVPVRSDQTSWNRSNGGLQFVARLKPGVTLAAAQRDLDALSATLAAEYPNDNTDLSAKLWTLRHRLYGGEEPSRVLLTLFGAVGLVLLIACVNVANLLLARATGRERELAVRTAMGASRARVLRQLLTESLVLALLGGAAGTVLSLWGSRLMLLAVPENFSLPRNIGIDGAVLLFTAGVTLLTGILFGLVPALQAARLDLRSLMGGRSGVYTRRRARARGALVVSQVALASVLLIAAGLMIRSMGNLLHTNPGFQAQNLLTMRVFLDASYDSVPKTLGFQQQSLERLRALPGVTAAGAVDWLPLAGTSNYNSFWFEERRTGRSENSGTVLVTPGYVETMGIQLLRGRSLEERDVRSNPGAVLINRAFAERHYPDADPIGRRVYIGFDGPDYPRTIVGIVDNVLHSGLTEEQRLEMYVPFAQVPWNNRGTTFVLRTRGEPLALLDAAQRAFGAVDPRQAVYQTRTMQRVIDESGSVVIARMLTRALSVFSALALLLAAIGLYGVIAYGVAQRTYEIGVRGALGATRTDILRLVMGQGLGLVILGLGIGLVGAFAATRIMNTMLFGVNAHDPLSFLQAAALLVAVSALATALPALRAARIDPSTTLRAE